MNYERKKFDGRIVLGDYFNQPYEVSMLPELPMIKFKTKKKWTIKITDIRFLNEMAIYVFEKCVEVASLEDGAKEAVFNAEFLDVNDIDLITAICMAIKYDASKRGDYIGGTLLITGCSIENGKLIMRFSEDMAHAFYEYAQTHKKDDGTVCIFLDEFIGTMIEKIYEL